MAILISGASEDVDGVALEGSVLRSGTVVEVAFDIDAGVDTSWLLLLFSRAILCSFIVDSVSTTVLCKTKKLLVKFAKICVLLIRAAQKS